MTKQLVFNYKGVCDGCRKYRPGCIPIYTDYPNGPKNKVPIWCPDYDNEEE